MMRRKAHVEHAIRFVEDQHLEVVEHHVLALEMIDESPRSRYDDVDAGPQLLLLRLEGYTTVHRYHAEIGVSCVFVHALFDLNAEFARRRQDQCPCATRSVEQPVDDR